MASYSVYFPGTRQRGGTDKLFHEAGIGDLLDTGCPVQFAEIIANGPDGGGGMYATWLPHSDVALDPPLRLVPEQKWVESSDKLWVGYEPERRPNHDDLIRQKTYSGNWLVLNDGQQWMIPSIQQLPHMHGLDKDGQFIRKVVSRYQEFCQKAWEYCEDLAETIGALEAVRQFSNKDQADEVVRISAPDGWEFACEALAMNYRLNPIIVSALELTLEIHTVSIISCVVELTQIADVLQTKKKWQDYVSIPVG